ncbi:MAG: hypothetical protein EOM64_01955 [Erysipelotrichia bacterium]|nr:hypothetical protein [Erysipelotrichia bacterium]
MMKNMIRKSLTVLLSIFTALAVFASPLAVLAISDGTYVIDKADLLSSDEIQTLNDEAARITKAYQCGVYIIVTDGYEGSSEDNYVRDLYKNNELGYSDGKSGVLIGLNITDRFVDMCAYGAASDVFTVSAINSILDDVTSKFGDGSWYDGLSTFLKESESLIVSEGYYYYEPVYTDEPSPSTNGGYEPTVQEYLKANPGIYFLGAAIVSIIAALAVTLILRSQLKNIGIRHSAGEYIKDNGVRLTAQYDYFIGTTISRVHIERDHDSSSGGYHNSGFSGGGGSTGRHF